jgi:surface carbohydrate biosynthesis protein
MVAAERGHEALVGDMSALLSHRTWLRPGVFHDKSLTPSRQKLASHARLVDAGFAVTSQDEEHWLLLPTYDEMRDRRFSAESLGQAAFAFAWGPHDASSLRAGFPDLADRVRETGSPRVDLWRPELAGVYADAELDGIDPTRPFVLVLGALGTPGPVDQNPFPASMGARRASYFPGPDDAFEWEQYERAATAYRYVGRMVRAIRQLAARTPDLQIVVRGHPVEDEDGWRQLLGPVDGVVVTRRGGLGRWLRHAMAVVHNGSTAGFEAAVAGVPAISFQPHGERVDWTSNLLGRIAHDEDDLVALIGAARDPAERARWYASDGDVLERRFAALDGPLAADRTVDAWEELDLPSRTNRVRASLLAATTHRRIGAARARLRERREGPGGARDGDGFDGTLKFPPIDAREVDAIAASYRRGLGRFADVEVRTVGPRLVEVRPARRAR